MSSDCSSVDVSFDVSMKRRGNIPAMNEINNRNFSQKSLLLELSTKLRESLRNIHRREGWRFQKGNPSIAKTFGDTSTILS